MLDLWYKNAVIYCLDVETYLDSNGDGVGDFRGLTDRLDHLEALGVTTVWLNPVYPSPNRDNGYDISDYYGIDPRLGTLGDFVEFSRALRDRGMRLLVDLVVNHTSVDHPWFQASREGRAPYADWYVWSEEKPDDMAEGIIFPGVQEAVWTYDRKRRAWYMHRFYEHQADLNVAVPAVREEILRIMGFWLELGVTGFRVDAAPFLVEYKGLKEEPEREPLLLLSEMRDFLDWREAGAIMLAEANVERDVAPDYFGGSGAEASERMNMLFDFPLNQRMWLALVRGEAEPIVEALRSRPEMGQPQAQWGVFLRNHDELSLDKLTEAERQECFEALAPEESMRIYDRGVRRRLAPMLGSWDRLALAHSLLFALPGTPVMWYGDEIGMGEDLSLDERMPVRTPMQWTPGGGFSEAEETVRPIVMDGPWGARASNVTDQTGRPDSLLRAVQRLVRTRRACPEIGWGTWEALEAPPAVLALRCDWRGGAVLTLHNLSGEAQDVSALAADGAHVLLPDGAGEPFAPLPAHGWRWIRLGGVRR